MAPKSKSKPKIKERYKAAEANKLALPTLPAPKGKRGPVPVCSGPIGELILARIASGETLSAICREEGMPDARTVQLHVLKNPDFAILYNQAHKMKYEVWADELKETGDKPMVAQKITNTNGGINGDIEKIEEYDAVDRATLKSKNMMWLMEKGDPERYGQKIATENTNNTNVNMRVTSVKVIVVDPKPMKTIDGR